MYNVLFIVVDCLRAKSCFCYGYERDTTPNIDKLANEGAIARRAITQSSFTLASAASMLTGTYPEVHGAIGFYDRVSGYTTMLPEYLVDQGFETTCFAGMNFFTGPWGLDRGFNRIDFLEADKQKRQSGQARADEISMEFIHYISSVSRPFFSSAFSFLV